MVPFAMVGRNTRRTGFRADPGDESSVSRNHQTRERTRRSAGAWPSPVKAADERGAEALRLEEDWQDVTAVEESSRYAVGRH